MKVHSEGWIGQWFCSVLQIGYKKSRITFIIGERNIILVALLNCLHQLSTKPCYTDWLIIINVTFFLQILTFVRWLLQCYQSCRFPIHNVWNTKIWHHFFCTNKEEILQEYKYIFKQIIQFLWNKNKAVD